MKTFQNRSVVIFLLVGTLLFAALPKLFGAGGDPPEDPIFVPKDGFIPNSDLAEDVAWAVLAGRYSLRFADSVRPYLACKKQGDRWVVTGRFKSRVEIRQRDGTILILKAEPQEIWTKDGVRLAD